MPLVGTVFAIVTGGSDRMSSLGLVGLAIGLVGVAAIVGGDFQTSDPVAILQVLVVAACYAIGPAILARRLHGLPSIGIMALSLGLTALLYLPIGLAQGPLVLPSANVLLSIAVLGIVCTAIAFQVFAALIQEIGPVRSTVITYVNPAVAAVLGVLVLHETLTVAMIAGFALVITGSVLATRPAGATPADADELEVARA